MSRRRGKRLRGNGLMNSRHSAAQRRIGTLDLVRIRAKVMVQHTETTPCPRATDQLSPTIRCAAPLPRPGMPRISPNKTPKSSMIWCLFYMRHLLHC